MSPPRSLSSLFTLDVTFPVYLLPSRATPAGQEPFALEGASPFPLENSALFPRTVVGVINPALEAYSVAFEQIFQRVGQFQGHASQRTVGTCPGPLGRFSPVPLSSNSAPDKASPHFGPWSSPSSALKGSPERRSLTLIVAGGQAVVDTPLFIVSYNQVRLTPPWKGTGVLGSLTLRNIAKNVAFLGQ